jgi:hypothetical protein
MVKQGANLEHENLYQETAFHIAIGDRNSAQLVLKLAKMGANIHKPYSGCSYYFFC